MITNKFNFEEWHEKMYEMKPGEHRTKGMFYREIEDLLDAVHEFYTKGAQARGALSDSDLDDMANKYLEQKDKL